MVIETSLVPRLFPPPVFDRLQYATSSLQFWSVVVCKKFGILSNQKLEAGMA